MSYSSTGLPGKNGEDAYPMKRLSASAMDGGVNDDDPSRPLLQREINRKHGYTGSIQEEDTYSVPIDLDGKPIIQNPLCPEDFKKAWGGTRAKQKQIEKWVAGLKTPDPATVAHVTSVLKYYGREADKGKLPIPYLGELLAALQTTKSDSTQPPLDYEAVGSGGTPGLPLPDSFVGQPKKSAKLLHFLTHLERYTFQNQTTWLQWAGMAGLAIIGGLAAWPDVPVFTVGFSEIFDSRLDLYPDANPYFQNSMFGYVMATALIDNIPRMAWCARRFLAPSTDEFSFTQHPLKKYLLYALVCAGASVPTVVQFYYLLGAEETFMDWASEEGYSTSPMKQMLYRWGPFYTIEGFVWSADQLNNFQLWSNHRFLKDEIPRLLPSPLAKFRSDTLEGLEALEEALYYMPNDQIRKVYNELYNPLLLEMMKAQKPDATYGELERMMGYYHLKYVLNMAGDLEEDAHTGKPIYRSSTEWLSIGGGIIASAGRLLGLQIVFQLLFQELSWGYISPEMAEYLGWFCSGSFGLFAQGFAEVIGSVDFFNEFLWNTEPQGETALKAIRLPAKLYTKLESIWNLIPLVALSLDGCDKFFGGNYYWMFLFAPYILNEFTAGVVTLSESYVKNIPTTLNRGYNRVRRLIGFENTIGYMRDELVLMVQRMHKLLKHADLDTLIYIKEEVVESDESQDAL